jgi:hypothetical protein
LNHTVRISRHCVAVRKLARPPTTGRWTWLRVWWRYPQLAVRSMAVHGWHLVGGQGNISWQARYNAASFDALRLSGGWRIGAGGTKRRAMRNLRMAVQESAGALPFRWAQNDPDLAYFRAARDGGPSATAVRTQWQRTVQKLEQKAEDQAPEERRQPSEYRLALKQARAWLGRQPDTTSPQPATLRLPARAWGEPTHRFVWCVVTIVVLGIALGAWALIAHVADVADVPQVVWWIAAAVAAIDALVFLFAAIDWLGGQRDNHRYFLDET